VYTKWSYEIKQPTDITCGVESPDFYEDPWTFHLLPLWQACLPSCCDMYNNAISISLDLKVINACSQFICFSYAFSQTFQLQ